jgi:hypothetical protein
MVLPLPPLLVVRAVVVEMGQMFLRVWVLLEPLLKVMRVVTVQALQQTVVRAAVVVVREALGPTVSKPVMLSLLAGSGYLLL